MRGSRYRGSSCYVACCLFVGWLVGQSGLLPLLERERDESDEKAVNETAVGNTAMIVFVSSRRGAAVVLVISFGMRFHFTLHALARSLARSLAAHPIFLFTGRPLRSRADLLHFALGTKVSATDVCTLHLNFLKFECPVKLVENGIFITVCVELR